MQNFVCATCGTQFNATETPPANCPICDDERQYVGYGGQQWSTLDRLKRAHHNRLETIEKNLIGIGAEPTFGIGHRSLLVRSTSGNILWDPTFLLDETAITTVRALGGIKWIAVSHPHLVTTCVEWSRAFGDAPIYWHTDNRAWVMRTDGPYMFWGGETCALGFGLTLIRCGGHFDGSTVLHWANGDEGRGALLTGDTIQVVSDRRYVSFMYSYPNQIPLNAQKVTHIVNAVEPYAFSKLYGGWWTSIVAADAKNAVKRSAARYIQAIQPSRV
ncbi:MAG: MBL fold metallo-hydrolase [Anaerolineae bacterium]|nr:MBL fold metallo-hydrolase [Anaerolineae bacterium]